MKSFRVEATDSEGHDGISRNNAQKLRVFDSNDPLIKQCEQDYEAAIEAVKIIFSRNFCDVYIHREIFSSIQTRWF